MSERPGIILYFDAMDPILRFLPNDSLGALVRAAIQYAQTGEVPDVGEDRTLCFAWETLRQKLDRDQEAYQARCEKNRENARKRWGEKESPPNAIASDGMQSHAMDAKRKGNPKGKLTPTETPKGTRTLNELPTAAAGGKLGGEPPPPPPGRAERYFMEKIDGDPSASSMERLRGFEGELGTDVCLRAIDEAVNAGRRSWNYLAAILLRKQEQGIRSLEDWDRQEARRTSRKNKGPSVCETSETDRGYAVPFDPGDLDKLVAEFREKGVDLTEGVR